MAKLVRDRGDMGGQGPSRYTKPEYELRIALEEQVQALRASARGFDEGHQWEAKRLAATVDVLVHDRGRRTISIMTQLGMKSGARFLSSGPPVNERNLLSETPLVFIQVGDNGAGYFPLLENGPPFPPRWLPFLQWWEEPVLRDQAQRLLSRKNLICSMRDQDGGAHLDGNLDDDAYVSFSRQNGAGWVFRRGGTPDQPVAPGPHLATVRQIAWELEQTLAGLRSSASKV